MLTLQLQPISRVSLTGLPLTYFQKYYLSHFKPVILTDFSKSWDAKDKWTLDYFSQQAGNVIVPLYGDSFAKTGTNYMKPTAQMNFGDYLELIKTEKTKLRMFLFNIFDHIPTLCNDFDYPPIVRDYLKKHPFLFFGGKGSHVATHYDADLSHVFLTQFCGQRRILLFPPSESVFLYRHPCTVASYVDLDNLDLVHYPHVAKVQGFECILQPHETLFIPSGYWHHIYYLEGGFGLSLRSPPTSVFRRLKGLLNILKLTTIDNSIRKVFGAERWYLLKDHIARRRANDYADALNSSEK